MKRVGGRFQANFAVLALHQHSMVCQDVGCHVVFVVGLVNAVGANAVICSILRGRVVGINIEPGRDRDSLLCLAQFSEADSSVDLDCVHFNGFSGRETELAFVALSVRQDLEFLAHGKGESLSFRVEHFLVLNRVHD